MASSLGSGVYEIRHLDTGRLYIGSAVCIAKRWKDHRRQLASGTHHSKFLQRSWDKHGEAAFAFTKLVDLDRDALIVFEQAYLDAFKPEFNSAPTAGSQLGYKHSEETRRRMSESRRKDFSPMKGKKHTDEAKRKISESRKGKGGGPRDPERLAKISAALSGRVISQEMRDRISRALMGHKQTAEQIEKRSQKLRGRKMPPGFAESQRQRMLGTKASSETRERLGRARASLDDGQVRQVRALRGKGIAIQEIARLLGIAHSTVADISCGRKYKWVAD